MLVLVVGPSGAGKDTLLGLAQSALAGDRRFRFVRRVITRAANAGNEDHEAVSEANFANRAFALRWHAHGLHYGIPLDITGDLARGVVVVANVSRKAIGEAAAKFPVRVVQITASPEILAQRLAARGRESTDDILNRLSRDAAIPDHVSVETVMNDTTPARAADRFLATIRRFAVL